MKSLQKTILKAGIIALGLAPIISNAQSNTAWSTSGNIGIGTNSPSYRLHVDPTNGSGGVSGTGGILVGNVGSNRTSLYLAVSAFTGGYSAINSTSDDTHYGNLILNQGGGNVGIGTGATTPTSTLQVAGTISGTALIVSYGAANGKILQSDAFGRALWVTAPTASQWITSGSNVYYSSGSVGVGTSSPAYKLDVNGTFNASSTSQFQADVIIGGTLNSNNIANSSNIHTANMIVDSYIQIGGQPKNGSGVLVPAGIPTGFGLSVKGKIYCQEVNVTPNDVNNWADYVFKSDYKLASLKEVEKYIEKNGHLENIPSAEEVTTDGYKVGEMDSKLLRKIEELTLYMLAQQKEIEGLKAQVGK
jgi:hypothetical protein